MSSIPPGLRIKICLYAAGLMIICLITHLAGAQTSYNQARPRIVVTADPELDDNNSLIRFLLYSSDLQIEGLIYASSGFHWKVTGKERNGMYPEGNMHALG